MIGYVVPHSLYPKGYHIESKLSLPFVNIASHNNYISLWYNCVYASEKLLKLFVGEYRFTQYVW